MGEAFILANKTKREYLHPLGIGHGYKLGEIIGSSHGLAAGAMLLLLHRGAHRHQHLTIGDATWAKRMLGRWIGDDIVLIGEYTDEYDTLCRNSVDVTPFLRMAVTLPGSAFDEPLATPVYDEVTDTFRNPWASSPSTATR